MFRMLRTVLLSAAIAIGTVTAVPAGQQAQPVKKEFPFEISIDVDECDRLCYAGHNGRGIKYRSGLAIVPDSGFTVTYKYVPGEITVNDLSAVITLIYESAGNTGTIRETVKEYKPGDIAEGEELPFFSDTVRESLAERKRLYSDSLQAVELKLSYTGESVRNKTWLFYVCDYDELEYFQDNAEISEDVAEDLQPDEEG